MITIETEDVVERWYNPKKGEKILKTIIGGKIMFETYHKIPTVYQRDPKTKHLCEGDYADKTIEMLKDIQWVATEKIDGTNIRVCWDGHKVTLLGRKDTSEIPEELQIYLKYRFLGEENAQLFEQKFGEKKVILFGEGIGEKIQGNPYKTIAHTFVLFDVLIEGNYQPRNSVGDIADYFCLHIAPVVKTGTLEECVNFVKGHPVTALSVLYEWCGKERVVYMEGVVCRPMCELRKRNGDRVVVKIKWNDFKKIT